MKKLTVMMIAGEASGDALAAELVRALRVRLAMVGLDDGEDRQAVGTSLEPRFFGAGGPRMKAAGVELALDLTEHAVFGLTEVLKQVGKFRRIGCELLAWAVREQPDVVVLVDYAGFNRRFAAALKGVARSRRGVFQNWRPRVVYFVSPQVWASREGRAYQLERDVDLLLSIFPFEKAWYAAKVPRLRVEFVGHPMLDRFRSAECGGREEVRSQRTEVSGKSAGCGGRRAEGGEESPLVLLLPGSRVQEVRRHVPVMAGVMGRIRRERPRARFWMVLPDEKLAEVAGRLAEVRVVRDWSPSAVDCEGGSGILCSIGRLAEMLERADLALASSGTVTMECAWFRVPTVVMYKVAWPTYWIGKQIVKVPYIAMPNLLAREALYPEFIQGDATVGKVGEAAVRMLTDAGSRERVRTGLEKVLVTLGGPGACVRAAEAIARLVRAG